MPGGNTGQMSIYCGLEAAKEVSGGQDAVVLIHDGVRPLINDKVIGDNIASVRKHGSAITTSTVQETILVVNDDESIDEDTKDFILRYVKNYAAIQKIDHFSSTPVGYQYVIVLTIYVDGNMTTFKSHELADSLEKDINSLDKVYNTIIHVNPI